MAELLTLALTVELPDTVKELLAEVLLEREPEWEALELAQALPEPLPLLLTVRD